MFSFIQFKIPIFLFFSIILILIIRIIMKKGSTGYYESLDKFLERETKANSVSKNFNELNLNYIEVTEKMFPFKEYEYTDENENIIKLQEIVRRKISLKMIKFEKHFTNTELKEMYGINNFEKISLYEEHFKGFIVSLYDWAKELYKKENFSDAKNILITSTKLNSEISRTYTLLADIYAQENNYEELKNLKNIVKNSSLSIKNQTLNYINKLI